MLSLYHGDTKVGEGRIKTQPGKFMIAGEGLCIGRDGGAGVTDDYPGELPWRFTGGTINRVAVDVSGEPYIDLEREAAGDADARVSRSGTRQASGDAVADLPSWRAGRARRSSSSSSAG